MVNDEVPTSRRVLRAVARSEGRAPIEIESALADAVDPDALDALYDRPGAGPTVAFAFAGHDVVVTESGTVHVDDPDPPERPGTE